jgi:dihydrolipoamide dehydrogenase
VLGGGPAGYPAAFFAADLGMDVTLIDREAAPGGVCLYRGCIPSKTLLHAAKVIHEARDGEKIGIHFPSPELDLEKLRGFSRGVVNKLTGGLGVLAKKRKIRFLRGEGRIVDPHTLQVTGDIEQRVSFDHLIIATGSSPRAIPSFPESPFVWDSTAALALPEIPARLLVVGAGYIGLELATVYASLGSQVTIVEASPRILSGADRDLVEQLEPRLRSLVHELLLSVKVEQLSVHGDGLRARLSGLDLERTERDFDRALVAVGRKPVSEGIGLENTAVERDPQGFIKVDVQRRTAEPNIFAIGDVAGEPMLAHKATYEARIAVSAIAGQASAYEPAAIPAVVFTDPELAWCGLTEEEARARRIEHRVSKFPWAASGRAATMGRKDGLTKMIVEANTGRVLGVGICGAGAAELIAEGVLAVEMGALIDDLQMVIHAHPTLSETMLEAAELFHGSSAHYLG